jgi:hypothetical protein
MATVVSLTEARIQELMAGWESVGISQDEINALVIQLRDTLATNLADINEFNTVTLPRLEADLEAGSNLVSELNDVAIPNLRADLDQAAIDLQFLTEVRIPTIEADLGTTLININDRPKVYVQAEPPLNPDDEGRYLVSGDTWYDTDDQNAHKIWNGVEWTTFKVDVADFTLTARKFLSTKHQLY